MAQPFAGVDTFLGTTVGGHAQTLLGHFLPTRLSTLGIAERVELNVSDSDALGDRIVGFQYRPANQAERGILHVFHGLAGSSDSFYMPRAAQSALNLGFSVVLWNHRGCGAGRKLALEPYHSGRSDDLARAVRWGRETNPQAPFLHGVLGYSLSGNAACLLAAQVIPAYDVRPLSDSAFGKIGALPDFVIAVNPPFDLKNASDRLSSGASRIYGQSFMGALLECLDDRKDWIPENESRRQLVHLARRARKLLSLKDTVGLFDAAYTGPAGGFRDYLDYYERASAGRHFADAKIPLIILSADDDPITHGFSDLKKYGRHKFPFNENPFIVIDEQTEGGHMGYIDRATLFSGWTDSGAKNTRWLERRITTYLEAFL